MTNVETWRVEIWAENTNNELNQLKEEMIVRIIEEIKKKDSSINFIWEKSIRKYLLGEKKDSFRNFFTKIGINIFSSSSEELKEFREKIKNINTKEELDNLEKSIIQRIDEKGNKENTWNENNEKSQTRNSSSNSNTNESSSNSSNNKESEVDSTIVSAKSWEAAKVPEKKEDRFSFLFPNWKPETKEEMKPYLTKIEVPIKTAEWKESNTSITVHKKLADVYKSVFQEMYDQNIPVNSKKTWAFNWRDVRGKKGKKSDHCWGWAIDLNRDVNGWAFWKTDKNSPYYNDNKTVEIRKKHGFARWWDWKKRNDPMHFTYTLW